MLPFDAIIAQSVKMEVCDYRQYPFGVFSATNQRMEKIDRHWIKARLAQMPRGSQSRLAEHLGLPPNVLSKVMSGKRDIQQDELPKLLSFFNARIVAADDASRDLELLLSRAARLNEDGLRLLQKQLDEMLQVPSLSRPAGNNEQDQ